LNVEEEQLDLSFAAFRRVATDIMRVSAATTQDGRRSVDLDASVAEDAAPPPA